MLDDECKEELHEVLLVREDLGRAVFWTMNSDDVVAKSGTRAERFEAVFARLLAREELDLYALECNVSRMFEIVAAQLMADIPGRKYHWYDGVAGLEARVRKARQIEFSGQMWVGDIGDARTQWKEEFVARVTDKRITKQGLWVSLRIGDDSAEGALADLL